MNKVSIMAATNDFTAVNGLELSGLTALIEDLKIRFKRHRLYRQTLNELSALSDRDLADLGLARGAIRNVAMQAAREAAL